MGIIAAAKRRTARREHRLRETVHNDALARGESAENAAALAERAVQQRRRRRVIMFSSG